MSLTYGFYNSIDGDRVYDAKQMGEMFDGVINDGIFKGIGNRFEVESNNGMTVAVKSGRAWFDHTWIYNDSRFYITIDNAELSNTRIDSIVIETNEATRINSIKTIKGTPEASYELCQPPELLRTNQIRQYRLCNIRVNPGIGSITNNDITSTIGSSECPYATIVTDTAGSFVTSFNGQTGAVTGVGSFNGRTGAITGVDSVNGHTGAVSIPSGIAYRDGLDAEGYPAHEFRFQFNDLTKRVNDHGRYEYVIATGIPNIKTIHVWNNSKLNVGAGYSDIPASQNLHMDGYDIIVRKLDSDSYMFEVFAIVGSTKGYNNTRAEGISRFITSERLSRCDLNHTHGVGLLSSSQKSSSTSWDGYIGEPGLNAGGEMNRLEFIYWDDSGNVHFIFDSNEDTYGYCSMSGRMEVLD